MSTSWLPLVPWWCLLGSSVAMAPSRSLNACWELWVCLYPVRTFVILHRHSAFNVNCHRTRAWESRARICSSPSWSCFSVDQYAEIHHNARTHTHSTYSSKRINTNTNLVLPVCVTPCSWTLGGNQMAWMKPTWTLGAFWGTSVPSLDLLSWQRHTNKVRCNGNAKNIHIHNIIERIFFT